MHVGRNDSKCSFVMAGISSMVAGKRAKGILLRLSRKCGVRKKYLGYCWSNIQDSCTSSNVEMPNTDVAKA
jgi:hypothetical protein